MVKKLNIITKKSPNFGIRKSNQKPNIVVIHYTAMRSAVSALDLLCDPKSEVSCHYLIDGNGQIFSLVEEKYRAWHAGQGIWKGCKDINSSSIGIELSNSGEYPYSFLLMESLVLLLKSICDRWSIDKSNIIGHSDLAPSRKRDPGRHFDWGQLEFYGLSMKTEVGQCDDDFWNNLKTIGYFVPEDLSKRNDLLEAFRCRFCQDNYGDLNSRDQKIANGIVKNLKFTL